MPPKATCRPTPPRRYARGIALAGLAALALTTVASAEARGGASGGSGTGNGLSASYYRDARFGERVLQRVDPRIDFDWRRRAPASQSKSFSVRWTGWIAPRYSDVYTFRLPAAGRVQLWVAGALLINGRTPAHPREISLVAGRPYPIRVDYVRSARRSRVRLLWTSARQRLEVVPTSRLLLTATGEPTTSVSTPPVGGAGQGRTPDPADTPTPPPPPTAPPSDGATNTPPVPDSPYVEALRKAASYFGQHVSDRGAYRMGYDVSLSRHDGFGQLPVTAQVGLAYVAAYEATGDRTFLAPAREIATVLERTQLGLTGGWWHDFYVDERAARPGFLFFRSDAEAGRAPHDNAYSVLRDDKTLSVLRFLIRLDRALGGSDAALRSAIDYGLDGLLDARYQPSGGFPDMHFLTSDARSIRGTQSFPAASASAPTSWPTTWPHDDWPVWSQYYSLNDGTTMLAIETLLEAWRAYGVDRYRDAALSGANWLLRAQFSDGQPGWAQMYDNTMTPRWQRAFEPPALATRESAWAVETLLHVYRLTGDAAYKEAALRATSWLTPLAFDRDGSGNRWWPLYVEFGSNKPLYVDTSNTLTNDRTRPWNWGSFELVDSIPLVLDEAKNVESASCTPGADSTADLLRRIEPKARRIVDSLDSQGRWVAGTQLSTQTFVENMKTLAGYVGLANSRPTYLDATSIARGITVVQDDPCRYLAH